MEENFSLELPQVAKASSAIEELTKSYSGAHHSVSSTEELEKLDLPQDTPVLICRVGSLIGNATACIIKSYTVQVSEMP